MNSTFFIFSFCLLISLSMTSVAEAKGRATVLPSKRAPAKVQPAKVQAAKVQPSSPRAPASATSANSGLPVKLPNVDPNSAVEIRGQARSLSMMLVLKNGKDSINFIKPRKDYKAEISTTEY